MAVCKAARVSCSSSIPDKCHIWKAIGESALRSPLPISRSLCNITGGCYFRQGSSLLIRSTNAGRTQCRCPNASASSRDRDQYPVAMQDSTTRGGSVARRVSRAGTHVIRGLKPFDIDTCGRPFPPRRTKPQPSPSFLIGIQVPSGRGRRSFYLFQLLECVFCRLCLKRHRAKISIAAPCECAFTDHHLFSYAQDRYTGSYA
jgi:hypothetical protein